MKLPSQRRIYKQDFDQQYQKLVETLASTLNINIESLYSALNNNASLGDNLFCSVRKVQVTVDSKGNPLSTTTFQIDSFLTSITGLQVLNVQNLTNSAGYPTSGVTVSFTQSQNGVVVLNVTGLIPNDLYQLTLVVWG